MILILILLAFAVSANAGPSACNPGFTPIPSSSKCIHVAPAKDEFMMMNAEAYVYCARLNAKLANPGPEESAYFISLVPCENRTLGCWFWADGYKHRIADKREDYRSITDQSIPVSWAINEPSFPQKEHCILFAKSKDFADAPCSFESYPACEQTEFCEAELHGPSFRRYCYRVSQIQMTQAEGRAYCEDHGQTLPRFIDAEELLFLYHVAQVTKTSGSGKRIIFDYKRENGGLYSDADGNTMDIDKWFQFKNSTEVNAVNYRCLTASQEDEWMTIPTECNNLGMVICMSEATGDEGGPGEGGGATPTYPEVVEPVGIRCFGDHVDNTDKIEREELGCDVGDVECYASKCKAMCEENEDCEIYTVHVGGGGCFFHRSTADCGPFEESDGSKWISGYSKHGHAPALQVNEAADNKFFETTAKRIQEGCQEVCQLLSTVNDYNQQACRRYKEYDNGACFLYTDN